jgi:hypothetical protein
MICYKEVSFKAGLFDDLRAGLAHMKRRAKQRSEGPIAFVKSNLSSTLDCLDSLQSEFDIMSRIQDEYSQTCLKTHAAWPFFSCGQDQLLNHQNYNNIIHVVKWMHDIVKLKRKNPVYTKIIVLSDKAILTYFFLNQDNVSEWGDMFIRRLLFQCASTIKIQLNMLV